MLRTVDAIPTYLDLKRNGLPVQSTNERAKRVASELGFQLDEISVGGGSDGNFAAAVGAAVLDGLGAVGDGGHAEHEHILVDSLAERTALAVGVATSLS